MLCWVFSNSWLGVDGPITTTAIRLHSYNSPVSFTSEFVKNSQVADPQACHLQTDLQ